ncbi:DsbA family protein [Streptomyces ureilyticus]|uniref:DsbA family protein n=1 Tax=Streptomyces ureilyticus TaxID=1775131 RepID=UPI0019D04F13|nr:DsbA family protein [Streptomyces ureilyticus]
MQSTGVPATTRLTVDVWADVLCPWCYLGERRLDTAIASYPHAAHIALRVHSFQLDPDAPTKAVPTLEYLAGKYGVGQAQARADSGCIGLCGRSAMTSVVRRRAQLVPAPPRARG